MNDSRYYSPTGGLPPQTQLLTDRAMFREAYAVIPRGTNSDIVTSFLPFWDDTRLWVLARPLTGFAETFSQYMVEVAPGGGSERPELDPEAEGVIFVTAGSLSITLAGAAHKLDPGGYAFIPPDSDWSVRNEGGENAHFHWIRKAYEPVEGLDAPVRDEPGYQHEGPDAEDDSEQRHEQPDVGRLGRYERLQPFENATFHVGRLAEKSTKRLRRPASIAGATPSKPLTPRGLGAASHDGRRFALRR